jgi:hypothetical protein
MMPSAASGFSLVNFVYELKDFRRLAQAFWNRRRIIQNLIGLDESGFRTQIANHPIKSLSKAYLNYSFAWRPLVSDLLSIYRALVSTEARLREIWRRQNTPQTRHYKTVLDNTANYDWTAYSADIAWNGATFYYDPSSPTEIRPVMRMHARYEEIPVYHATMRYTYSCPGVLDTLAKLRGWLDAFGVRLDASIIWNAIPFSFIIDWVVDVGGFLRRFSEDNLGLQVVIEDFCSSVSSKIIKETDVSIRRKNTSTGVTTYGDSITVSRVKLRRYERRVGIPNLYSALVTSGLSIREASLGSALIVSGGGHPRS